MALIQAEDMELGDQVTLEFQIPGLPETLSLPGQVVRKMPPDGIGVMFIELPPAARNAIQRFITREVKS
jgi:Tfp pilus assembly protein PilZ